MRLRKSSLVLNVTWVSLRSLFWLNGNGKFPDVPKNMYYCDGHDGQDIFIFPSLQLVVVVLGFSPKPDNVIDFNALLREIIKIEH